MVNAETVSIIFAGLSIGLAAIYYMMTLRNAQRSQQLQLETRQAQLFMDIYIHLATEEASKADYDLFHLEFRDVDDWNEIIGDKEKYTAWNIYATYFEGVGLLVRKQLLDIDTVARLMSGGVTSWWDKYEAGIKACREHYGWPRFMIEAEYLYQKVIEYGRDHPELNIAAPQFYQPPP